MSVWISDIQKYYAEAVRILSVGGVFIVNEYHPIRRIWLDASGEHPHHDYFKRGPRILRMRGYQRLNITGLFQTTFRRWWTRVVL